MIKKIAAVVLGAFLMTSFAIPTESFAAKTKLQLKASKKIKDKKALKLKKSKKLKTKKQKHK